MKAFKAYDIRGVYPTDIDEELAYKVGRCIPALLDAKTVLVGRDARLSSEGLHAALVCGLTEAGADVEDLGHATTPMVYFFTAERHHGASVMITASHNPPEYNGLKVSREGAKPVNYDGGLNTVEQWIVEDKLPPKAATPGRVTHVNLYEPYVAWLKQYLPPISEVPSFAVDCSDGAAGFIAKQLFGASALYLNAVPDGAFPHHGPNPLEAENRVALEATVRADEAMELGLIFDGDADRVGVVDEKGRFIPPDMLLPFMADILVPLNAEGKRIDPYTGKAPIVVHDVRTSLSVTEKLHEMGFETQMVKVGAAFAKRAMRELKGLCGAEVAGHYYFREFHWCDSGELAAIIVLRIVEQAKAQGKTLSAYIADVTERYNSSGEINIHGITDTKQAIQVVYDALIAKFGEPVHVIDFDGIRLDWEHSWAGVRASNTEPILRLTVEAPTIEALEEMLTCIKTALGI